MKINTKEYLAELVVKLRTATLQMQEEPVLVEELQPGRYKVLTWFYSYSIERVITALGLPFKVADVQKWNVSAGKYTGYVILNGPRDIVAPSPEELLSVMAEADMFKCIIYGASKDVAFTNIFKDVDLAQTSFPEASRSADVKLHGKLPADFRRCDDELTVLFADVACATLTAEQVSLLWENRPRQNLGDEGWQILRRPDCPREILEAGFQAVMKNHDLKYSCPRVLMDVARRPELNSRFAEYLDSLDTVLGHLIDFEGTNQELRAMLIERRMKLAGDKWISLKPGSLSVNWDEYGEEGCPGELGKEVLDFSMGDDLDDKPSDSFPRDAIAWDDDHPMPDCMQVRVFMDESGKLTACLLKSHPGDPYENYSGAWLERLGTLDNPEIFQPFIGEELEAMLRFAEKQLKALPERHRRELEEAKRYVEYLESLKRLT